MLKKLEILGFSFNWRVFNIIDKYGEKFTIGRWSLQEWSSTFTGNSARPQCFGSEKNDSEWAGFGTSIRR